MSAKLRFAEFGVVRYVSAMTTLAEIQEAVTKLRDDEKEALSLWLNSQTNPGMSADEERRLLSSLDEAIRDVDAGKGVSIEDARKQVASWAVK
ncbi:MAG: hypothetical protein L0Z50_28905 [Verrucomicrobiales bacterium]|nr:hypothetical protein [Verrucomicrobiales bacterium]